VAAGPPAHNSKNGSKAAADILQGAAVAINPLAHGHTQQEQLQLCASGASDIEQQPQLGSQVDQEAAPAVLQDGFWQQLALGDKAFLSGRWQESEAAYREALPLSAGHLVSVSSRMLPHRCSTSCSINPQHERTDVQHSWVQHSSVYILCSIVRMHLTTCPLPCVDDAVQLLLCQYKLQEALALLQQLLVYVFEAQQAWRASLGSGSLSDNAPTAAEAEAAACDKQPIGTAATAELAAEYSAAASMAAAAGPVEQQQVLQLAVGLAAALTGLTADVLLAAVRGAGGAAAAFKGPTSLPCIFPTPLHWSKWLKHSEQQQVSYKAYAKRAMLASYCGSMLLFSLHWRHVC
jgi:hypothetical protein